MPPSGLGRAFVTRSTCTPKRNTGCGLLQSALANGEPGLRQWWRKCWTWANGSTICHGAPRRPRAMQLARI
eukprot:768472-Rhodomonas_salina.1